MHNNTFAPFPVVGNGFLWPSGVYEPPASQEGEED